MNYKYIYVDPIIDEFHTIISFIYSIIPGIRRQYPEAYIITSSFKEYSVLFAQVADEVIVLDPEYFKKIGINPPYHVEIMDVLRQHVCYFVSDMHKIIWQYLRGKYGSSIRRIGINEHSPNVFMTYFCSKYAWQNWMVKTRHDISHNAQNGMDTCLKPFKDDFIQWKKFLSERNINKEKVICIHTRNFKKKQAEIFNTSPRIKDLIAFFCERGYTVINTGTPALRFGKMHKNYLEFDYINVSSMMAMLNLSMAWLTTHAAGFDTLQFSKANIVLLTNLEYRVHPGIDVYSGWPNNIDLWDIRIKFFKEKSIIFEETASTENPLMNYQNFNTRTFIRLEEIIKNTSCPQEYNDFIDSSKINLLSDCIFQSPLRFKAKKFIYRYLVKISNILLKIAYRIGGIDWRN